MESHGDSISWFLENMVSPLMRWNQCKIACPNADFISRHHIVIWYRMAKRLLSKKLAQREFAEIVMLEHLKCRRGNRDKAGKSRDLEVLSMNFHLK